jgi:LPXTG-motif cell wall-anchored protein
LQQTPGAGGVMIDGESVPTEVVSVTVPAAQVAPESRTPEQVVEVQAAAQELVDAFNAAAPAGTEPLVTVTNTDTGAVVNGVLVDPRDGVTPVPVPVEDVLMVSAADMKVLLAAATDAGVPEEVTGGVLEVAEGGVVSALAYGLPNGVAGEVVIFSTPTLLGSFTTGGDGSFAGQLTLPELEPGAHTLVLTAGGVTSSLGLMVAARDGGLPTPTPGVLPSTGGDVDGLLLMAAAMFMVLGVVVLTRRRLW